MAPKAKKITKSKLKPTKSHKAAERTAAKAAEAKRKELFKLNTNRANALNSFLRDLDIGNFSRASMDYENTTVWIALNKVSSYDTLSVDIDGLIRAKNALKAQMMFMEFEIELDQGYSGCGCCSYSSDSSAEGQVTLTLSGVTFPDSVLEIK
jgi:hypothetical protein